MVISFTVWSLHWPKLFCPFRWAIVRCDYAKYSPVCLALTLWPAAVCNPPLPPSFNGMFSQDLRQLFSVNAFGTCGTDRPDTPVLSSELLFFQHTLCFVYIYIYVYCTDTMQHIISFSWSWGSWAFILEDCNYYQFKRKMAREKKLHK